MLVIRAEQMEIFERIALRKFEDEMISHSKKFSPRLCEVIGDEQLRAAVNPAISRAMDFGFTNRGPIRLFIEMMFLYGSRFDTDPQYPMIGEILRSSGDQMQRAEQIHKGHLDYHENVNGEEAVNVYNALRSLRLFAQMPIKFSSEYFFEGMRQEMHNIFPQKADYVGEEALTALINEGRTEAQKYAFSLRGQALMVALMHAFGHGCTDDPLYPWISRTLKDERIIDSAAREDYLERKALVWLKHVLAGNKKEDRT